MRVEMDNLTGSVRILGSSTPEGARARRRALAGGAFLFFLLGFLAVAGLGRPVLLALLACAALGTLAAVWAVLSQIDIRRHASKAQSAGAGAARGVASSARSGAQAAARARPKNPRSQRREALRLNARGLRDRREGNYEQAVESHRAALKIMRGLGDRRSEAMTLNSLALALAQADDEQAAVDTFERALAVLRELPDEQREGQVLANLGFVHSRNGHRQEAAACLRAALQKLSPESQAYRRVEEQLRRAS